MGTYRTGSSVESPTVSRSEIPSTVQGRTRRLRRLLWLSIPGAADVVNDPRRLSTVRAIHLDERVPPKENRDHDGEVTEVGSMRQEGDQDYQTLACDLAGFFDFDEVAEALCYLGYMTRHGSHVRTMKGNMIKIVKEDFKSRFEILYVQDEQEQTPWAIRATSGWGYPFIDLELACHRLTKDHLPLLECLVHRTSHITVKGILDQGLLPGGPSCWTTDVNGDYVRVELDPAGVRRSWGPGRGGRSGGRSSAMGQTPRSAETMSSDRFVAMMSPVAMSGNARAVGDRAHMPFAIFFDVEELLDGDVPLYLGYNGAVMCNVPLPAEAIIAVQDTRKHRLVYSRALIKYKLVDVEDTPEVERRPIFTSNGGRCVKPDAEAGEISCPYPECGKTIYPGYVHCYGCGRIATYEIGDTKEEDIGESGGRSSTVGPRGEESGSRSSATGPPPTAASSSHPYTTAKAGPKSQTGLMQLSKADRKIVYGDRGHDKAWRTVRQNLRKCQLYHETIRKNPAAVFNKSDNFTLDPSVGADKAVLSLEKRKLCHDLLTRDGLYAKVISDTTSEEEKNDARQSLCDLYFVALHDCLPEQRHEVKGEAERGTSESSPGDRNRKGVVGVESSAWLDRRSPHPDSGAESGSATKRRSR